MKLKIVVLAVLAALPTLAQQTPSITQLTNGADATHQVMSGQIGATMMVLGNFLASGNTCATESPLPTSLLGTSVTVGITPAHLLCVAPNMITFEVPPGQAWRGMLLFVTTPYGKSGLLRFSVALMQPTLYEFHPGVGDVMVQNVATGAWVGTGGNPPLAASNSEIYVFGNAFGSVSPVVPDGELFPKNPVIHCNANVTATMNAGTPYEMIPNVEECIGFPGTLNTRVKIRLPAYVPAGYFDLILNVVLDGVTMTTRRFMVQSI